MKIKILGLEGNCSTELKSNSSILSPLPILYLKIEDTRFCFNQIHKPQFMVLYDNIFIIHSDPMNFDSLD